MKKTIFLAALTLMAGMAPAGYSFGQGFLGETAALIEGLPEAHLYVAIAQTTEALEDGRSGDAEGFSDHARAALVHAETWRQLNQSPYANKAVSNLKSALSAAPQNMGVATTNASKALRNLEATRP